MSVVSVKRIRWFVGIASFALIIWFVRDLLQPTHLIARYSEFKLIIQNQYLWSAVIFFLIYLAVVSLSLPVASLLTLMGAALFGWISLPIIVSAATAGALVVFLLASTIAREFFSQRAGGAIDSVQTAFHRSPIRWLLTMRLIPFFSILASEYHPGITTDENARLCACDSSRHHPRNCGLCECRTRVRYNFGSRLEAPMEFNRASRGMVTIGFTRCFFWGVCVNFKSL